jgi:hypothetical protein
LLTSREHVGNGIFLCLAGWASDDTGPSRWSFSWVFSWCFSRYFSYWYFSWRFFCSFYWAFRKSSVAYFYQGRSRDPDPISRVVGLFASRYYMCRYLHVDTCVLLLVCFTLCVVSLLDHLCMPSMNLYISVYGTCNGFLCMASMNLSIFMCICSYETSKTAKLKKSGTPYVEGIAVGVWLTIRPV